MKSILVSLLFLFFFHTNDVFSQVTDIDANYNFEKENYDTALKQYLRLIKKDKDNYLYNFRIGFCYLNTNVDKAAALPYLQTAIKYKEADKQITHMLARAYYYNFEFDKALALFNEYLSNLPDNEKNQEEIYATKRDIQVCTNASELVKKPQNVTFVNLDENINSKNADINPFLTDRFSTLLYSSNRRYLTDIQAQEFSIYFSKLTLGSWIKAKTVGNKVNTSEDERLMGISSDGDVMFVQPDSYTIYQDLFMSKRKRGRYKELEKLGKSVNSKFNESGGFIAEDNQSLYFSSNRPGGFGGMDIYVSKKLPNGEWGEPVNVGPVVNSQYDEEFPQLTDDGKTLYFSSNGFNSIGGYDLFVSKWKGLSEEWSEPENLGYPINSLYDNFLISFGENKRIAFVSDVRENGFGDYDIYKVVFNDIEPEYQIYTGVIAVGDSINGIPIKKYETDIEINIYNAETEEMYGSYTFKKNNGRYVIALPPGRFYLEVLGEGFEPFHKIYEVKETLFVRKDEIKQDIYLNLAKQ